MKEEHKYYIVFSIDYSTATGRDLAARMDINDTKDYIIGFHSKSKLKDWLNYHLAGLHTYTALKPIS